MGIKITIHSKQVEVGDVISFDENGAVVKPGTPCPIEQIMMSKYVAIKASEFFTLADCCKELYDACFAVDECIAYGEHIEDYIVFKHRFIDDKSVFVLLSDVNEHNGVCLKDSACAIHMLQENIDEAEKKLRELDKMIGDLESQRYGISENLDDDKIAYEEALVEMLDCSMKYSKTVDVAKRITAFGLILEEQRGE